MVTLDGVVCDTCEIWHHYKCEQLSGDEIKLVEQPTTHYNCRSCTSIKAAHSRAETLQPGSESPSDTNQVHVPVSQAQPRGHFVTPKIPARRDNALMATVNKNHAPAPLGLPAGPFFTPKMPACRGNAQLGNVNRVPAPVSQLQGPSLSTFETPILPVHKLDVLKPRQGKPRRKLTLSNADQIKELTSQVTALRDLVSKLERQNNTLMDENNLLKIQLQTKPPAPPSAQFGMQEDPGKPMHLRNITLAAKKCMALS